MGGATMSWDDSYRTSDEILDTGRQGLDFFAQFIPMYAQANAIVGGGRSTGVNMADIQRSYDDMRGIDFSMMRTDADHLNTAIESAENHQHNLDRYWGSLSTWTGDASNAARQHRDTFDGMTATFIQNAKKAPGAITGGVSAIQTTLISYVNRIRRLYSDKCGGMTPDEVRGAIQAAQGNIQNQEAAQFLAKAFDVSAGFFTYGISWMMNMWGWGASSMVEQLRQQAIDQAKQSLRNYLMEFDYKKSSFDSQTQSAQQAVQRNYDTMLTNLKPMTDDPYKGIVDPSDFRTTPAQSQTPTGQQRVQAPTAPGAGTRPGSTTTPSATTPSRTPTPVGASTTPTLPSSTTGGTGTTPQIPTVPQVPTTQPQLPTTPQVPGTTPQVPGAGQPVTVRNGNSTVTVSPPDAQGRVHMTVSDGVNPPKNYDLDFGRGTNPSSITGTSGIGGSSLPQLPTAGGSGIPSIGSGGGTSMPTMPTMPSLGGLGGGGGSTGGSGSSKPTMPSLPSTPKLPSSMFPFSDTPSGDLQPGDDGKFTIHDGDVTITVDPDKTNDGLTLTLDDGKGHTTSYHMDYHDPANPTVQETSGLSGGVPSFGPTGLSTPSMPDLPSLGSMPSSDFHVPDPVSLAGAGHAGGAGIGGGVGGGGGHLAAASMSGPGATGHAQLDQGSFTGQVGNPQQQGPGLVGGGPVGGGGPGGGGGAGGPQGGGMMGGGMGAGAGQGNKDNERGGNRWLGRNDVISEEPGERQKAVKAGGVIGEDRKK